MRSSGYPIQLEIKILLCRAINLEKDSGEYLRWTHLEEVLHRTDQPLSPPDHISRAK